jgi:hypothetical protein
MIQREGRAMKSLRVGSMVLGALLLAAAAFGQEAAPTKYLLKEVPPAVGDVSVRALKDSMSMQLRAVPEGSDKAVIDAPLVNRKQMKYTETVLAASGSNPTYYTRRYAIAKESKTDEPGGPETTRVLPRQGKTLTVRIKNKAVTITTGKDKLPAEELQALKRELGERPDIHEFYPSHEVGPGDEWSQEGMELAKAFGGATAKMSAKFEDLVEYEGYRCARISFRMEIEGKQGGLPMSMKLTGEVKHSLDLHRDLITTMDGDLSINQKLTRDGVTLNLTGDGIATVVRTEVWLKVAGKPVVKPKPSPAPPAARAQ